MNNKQKAKLDAILMELVLDKDNPFEILKEVDQLVDGYRTWMTNLAKYAAGEIDD